MAVFVQIYAASMVLGELHRKLVVSITWKKSQECSQRFAVCLLLLYHVRKECEWDLPRRISLIKCEQGFHFSCT